MGRRGALFCAVKRQSDCRRKIAYATECEARNEVARWKMMGYALEGIEPYHCPCGLFHMRKPKAGKALARG